uniref:AAA family ATPase n=1 Tax=Cryobacterium sp. Y62 TaxID=2048284 RepID=UPI001304A09A
MFKRFKHIGDYRIYRDWSDGVGIKSFERINLIFGTNGSGKSTLAQLLQDSVDGVLPTSADIKFLWQDSQDSGEEEITSVLHDAWRRVHVFNKDYVVRSLRFESVDGPQPDALLTLGEENVAAEVELEQKRARSAELTTERANLRKQIVASTKAAEDLMRSAAQTVVSHLGKVSNQYRATNVYNITHVRTDLPRVFRTAELVVSPTLPMLAVDNHN